MTKGRFFIVTFVTMLCTLVAHAQISDDGFYRVRNYGSDRFIYITDKFGSYDMNRDIGDFSALQLWREKDVISDVSTVIYITKKGENLYDLQGQGTGIYKLISRYVNVYRTTSGVYKDTYQVYATEKGVTKYLTDNESSEVPDGTLGTSGTGAYRQWEVLPVSVESEDNYFGITPTITIGEKYYYPMYASFDFDLVSEGMKAYVVKTQPPYYYIEEYKGIVPAGSAVIIECSSPNATDNRINLRPASNSSISDNLLKGVYFCNPGRETIDQRDYDSKWFPGIEFDPSTMRVLGVTSEGKLGLVSSSDNLTYYKRTKKYYLPANQAYLPCEVSVASELRLYDKGDVPTAVDEVAADDVRVAECVDLSGRRLEHEPAKGIFIKGGKLYIK